MDIQLKRGILDVCVLAAIKDNDSYGYQIIKDIKPYIEMTESTLYTILKRLENTDMLTVYSIEHNGRLRKYYRITNAGKDFVSDKNVKYQQGFIKYSSLFFSYSIKYNKICVQAQSIV